MALKPTPTKVVLLMSAAGLGLSWSGAALASRDDNAPASFAWTFGTPPRAEQGCDPRTLNGFASCPLPGGEMLRTIVADAAALPLPSAPAYSSNDAKASFRAFDAYAARHIRWPDEARTGDGEPEPSNETPRPDMPAAPRVNDGSGRDHETDVVAMVFLDDPQDIADATAAVSEPADHLASVAPRTLDQPFTGDSRAKRAGAEGELARVAVAIAARVGPSSAHEGKTPAAFADDQVGSPSVAFQAADRDAKDAQVSTRADPALSDSAAIERVFASLAEVLGSQLEELSPALETSQQQTAAPRRDIGLREAADLAAVDPAPVSISTAEAPSNDGRSLKRASEADDIVVASSHSDKILLSLAALRSGDSPEVGRFGAQTKKTIVVRHADKVLETLALFQSKAPKPAAFACTQEPEEGAQIIRTGGSLGAWEFPEPAGASASTAFEHEPDILLDLSPPIADRPAAPILQAVPARPAQSDQHAAGRTDRNALGSDLVALRSDKLDEVRGGFVTDTGLKVSFGIERAVYLNGNLVTTTSLNIADLSKISGGQAQVTGTGAGSLALVQSGTGNFAPGSISSTAAGTVIQNTLDNQKINTITRIDAVINSANIMRSMNLQSSMRSAVINSLQR
jgi:hypothetical protein